MYRSGFTIVPQHEGAQCGNLLKAVEQGLRDRHARTVANDGSDVSFTSGSFRSFIAGSFLASITKGRINLDRRTNRITYYLSLTRLIITGSAVVAFVAICMLLAGMPVAVVGIASLVALLWVLGVGRLMALALFDGFIKRCVRDAEFSVQRRKKEVVSS
jgi:hypothetical protein